MAAHLPGRPALPDSRRRRSRQVVRVSTTRFQRGTRNGSSPSDWRKTAPDDANWPVVEIASPGSKPRLPEQGPGSESDDERFRWCLDASIGALVGPASSGRPRPSPAGADDWLRVLRKIRRDRLTRGLRPFFDDLLIDALEEAGLVDELTTRLATDPADRACARVWQALESSAMARLARLSEQGGKMSGLVMALDLWDEVMRLDWPKSSHFPAHFTERVAALSSPMRTGVGSGSTACSAPATPWFPIRGGRRTPRSSRPNERASRPRTMGRSPIPERE